MQRARGRKARIPVAGGIGEDPAQGRGEDALAAGHREGGLSGEAQEGAEGVGTDRPVRGDAEGISAGDGGEDQEE